MSEKLLPHQQRVVDERDELQIKLQSLLKFMGTDKFSKLPEEEKSDLADQSYYMLSYRQTLDSRIRRFNN